MYVPRVTYVLHISHHGSNLSTVIQTKKQLLTLEPHRTFPDPGSGSVKGDICGCQSFSELYISVVTVNKLPHSVQWLVSLLSPTFSSFVVTIVCYICTPRS